MIFLQRLSEHYQRVAVGFGLATAAIGAVFAIFDHLPTLRKVTIVVAVYLSCGAAAYVVSRYMQTGFLKKRIDNDQAGEAFLVEKPEDNLAHIANKFARRFFGQRRTISYNDYKVWRKRNPLIFTAVTGRDRELYGYFDIFPLVDEVGEKIRDGALGEEDVKLEHIVPETDIESANYIYIATAQSCVVNELFDARLAQLLAEFMWEKYPPRPGRLYVAFAATEEGARLLKRNHFILELNKELTACKRDLFVLSSEDAHMAFERIRSFRQKFKRKSAKRRTLVTQRNGGVIAGQPDIAAHG